MSDDIRFIEFGEFVNPLEKLARDYVEKGGSDAGLGLLRNGVVLMEGTDRSPEFRELQSMREAARRDVEISEAEIEQLRQCAETAGEESYEGQYALAELLQASAVANASLMVRNMTSEFLAVAAKSAEQFERARIAYADALEGLQIMLRFFQIDRNVLTSIEQALQDGWNSVCDKTDARRAILDPARDDPAEEWLDMVLWNSNMRGTKGLLAQVDATARLAIRLEHWQDARGLSVEGPVMEMLDRCEAMTEQDDSWLALRCMVTLGDALVEIAQWDLGKRTFARFLPHGQSDLQHPMVAHAIVQGAYCSLMANDADGCRSQLDMIPKERLVAMSDLVLTVSAELARYIAVEALWQRETGQGASPEVAGEVRRLMGRVSMIVTPQPSTRTEYLQTLFFAVLARDLESMEAFA